MSDFTELVDEILKLQKFNKLNTSFTDEQMIAALVVAQAAMTIHYTATTHYING